MAWREEEGIIPEQYLTKEERETQYEPQYEITYEDDKEVSRREIKPGYSEWHERGIYTSPDTSRVASKTGEWVAKGKFDPSKFEGNYLQETRSLGQSKAEANRLNTLALQCKLGNKEACLVLAAKNKDNYIPNRRALLNKAKQISRERKVRYAEGGLMSDSSRLWKMESQYPEFQKGIASKVTKDKVPTAPVEERFMYSPLKRGYAEGGMLEPELPFDMSYGEEEPSVYGEEEDQAMLSTLEQVLAPEEQEILAQALTEYPELEVILDKATEALVPDMGDTYEGEGPVSGPGTETSDSINAKLSDGEFVFTAKAVKQLGVDKLRKMMDKAETEYDESLEKQTYKQVQADSEGEYFLGGLLTKMSDAWQNRKNTYLEDEGFTRGRGIVRDSEGKPVRTGDGSILRSRYEDDPVYERAVVSEPPPPEETPLPPLEETPVPPPQGYDHRFIFDK